MIEFNPGYIERTCDSCLTVQLCDTIIIRPDIYFHLCADCQRVLAEKMQ